MSRRLRPIRREWLRQFRNAIATRTHGRLRDLRIESEDGRVVIRGRCGSYHVVQLALAAAETTARQLQSPVPRLTVHVNGRQLTLRDDSEATSEEVSETGPQSDGRRARPLCCVRWLDVPLGVRGAQYLYQTASDSDATISLHPYGMNTMAKGVIVITAIDRERLERLLTGELVRAMGEKSYLEDLQGELQRARTVASTSVPVDVITMNSTVRLRDADSGEEETFTLVYPRDANIASNRLSILAPIGTAILGCRVGDVVCWKVPSGVRRLTVEEILYQPERVGALHL